MAPRSPGRGGKPPRRGGSHGSASSRSSYRPGRGASDRAHGGEGARLSNARKARAPDASVGEGRSSRGAPDRVFGRGTRSVAEEIRSTARPGQGDLALRAFEEAVDLLQRNRTGAAVSSAQRAKDLAPRSGLVREVLGIALYRAERFRDALRELQAYRRMTGRLDQNHLIADCYRALGSPEKAVDPAREALKARLPDDVRAEAAIVGGSALADLGRFTEALSMLSGSRTSQRLSRDSDLRVWYVMGDILERAGRRTEAAAEFSRIVRHDAGAFDAAERLARLGQG
jgi:tetratricopeptide (TPR) repeat protein